MGLVVVVFTVAGWSCGENQQPKRDAPDSLEPVSMPRSHPKSVMAPANKSAPNQASPAASNDAQWTIYCQAIGGPTHVELANALKTQLVSSTPLKDWYVIHEDSQSVLYYGFYRSIDSSDAKDSIRAHSDQKQIQSMATQNGEALFPHCYFVEVTTPDPAAPSEWNLANANGYWSLQIAAYKDSPRRKEFAVDAVREARKQGIPAYFYHGETTSSVCIGAWPRSAVKEQDESTANAPDPSQPLLVLSQPLPAGAPTEVMDKEGNRVRALAPRLEPLDPSLIDAMQKYPNHVVNGVINTSRVKDSATGEMKEVQDPSFLVLIPQKQPTLLSNESQITPANPTAGAAPIVQPPPQPAGGKLRSLQD